MNCDLETLAGVDEIFDFGLDGWPFENGSVDEIWANHCLEHSRGLLHAMSEAYRVLVPGGKFEITVPDPRSLFFIGDPTHVMPITLDTMLLFSREWCEECQAKGAANTPLALRLGVDFKLQHVERCVSEAWKSTLLNEDLSIKDQAEFDFAVASYNNVIDSSTFILQRI